MNRPVLLLCIVSVFTLFSACSSDDEHETKSESSSIISSEQTSVNTQPPQVAPSSNSEVHSSSAAPVQAEIEPNATTIYIELSSTTIKLDQISDSFQVPYKTQNNSSREVHGSPEYSIEQYNGTDWELLPHNEQVIPNWPSVVFSIPANTAFEHNLSFFAYDGGFVSGQYRIVQYVWEEGKSGIPLYAEFSVTE